MNDKEPVDQTGLHALGLLDERERLDYERELAADPALRQALRETRDQLAAIALTAPQVVPPAGVWDRIEDRLNLSVPGTRGNRRTVLRLLRFHPAWAAVAALAALSTWLGVRHHEVSARLTALENSQAGRPGKAGPRGGPAPGAERGGPRPGQEPGDLPGGVAQGAAGRELQPLDGRTMRAMGLPASVQIELDRLRAAQRPGEPTPNGVADLRLMEMHPPGREAPARREGGSLVTKVADAIAAAAAAANPAAPLSPTPAVLRGQGSSPASDIVIEQGGTVNLNSLNLHPDAQVVHQNFPADSEFGRYGLSRLDADRVWDGNGGIWYRQPDGHSYLGQKAPAGFHPPDPDDPAPVADTTLRPGPAKPAAPEPYAFPVISNDGQGMIVTQNLPEPAPGFGYALWSQDANGGSPVLLGFLPQAEGVNGVFSFDLPPGTSVPGGYRITRQILTDVTTPGSTLLQGP